MYNSEVETPRNDASVGVYLKYTPDFGFEAVPTQKSGLFINGDVKDMEFISFNENEYDSSYKFFKKLDGLESNHPDYASKYLYSIK